MPETGGGSGMRTHGDVAATTVFKTVAGLTSTRVKTIRGIRHPYTKATYWPVTNTGIIILP